MRAPTTSSVIRYQAFDNALAELMIGYIMDRDLLLIGNNGCGKSVLARFFADTLYNNNNMNTYHQNTHPSPSPSPSYDHGPNPSPSPNSNPNNYNTYPQYETNHYTKVVVVNCYQDLSSRDLLLRRTTNEDKSTCWQMSPLLEFGVCQGMCMLLYINIVSLYLYMRIQVYICICM